MEIWEFWGFTQQKKQHNGKCLIAGTSLPFFHYTCPCGHLLMPTIPQQLALVPQCFRMVPLLLKLVELLCASWAKGLSSQHDICFYSSSISNIHWDFRLNLDALKKDTLPTTLRHLATHISLKSMKNVLQKSLFMAPHSPLTMCMSFLFIPSRERERPLNISFSHQLRLDL